MPEQLLNTLGPKFAIPAILVVAGLWIFQVLSGLQDSRRRNRLEFLDLWQDVDNMDDLRLEVTVRHLAGHYFPASVIRAINRMAFPTQRLFDLAEIWPMLEFNPQEGGLEWKRPGYASRPARRRLRVLALAGYVACALASMFFLSVAVGMDPGRVTTWISGLNTMLFVFLAWACLARSDALSTLVRHGDEQVETINLALRATPHLGPARH